MSSKKKEAWRSLYPFTSHYHKINGFRLHYLDEGKGEPVLFVHGNPTWSFYWRNLIIPLKKQARCIAPDHIGCGLSDKPGESEYPFTLERRISDLCELIEQLNLRKITLVAHDWGGAVGMGAAVELPDRFHRFVLMNTGAFPSPRCPLRIRICRTPFLGRFGVQGLNLFARSALFMAVNKHKRMSRDVKSGLLAPYDNWKNRLAVYRFVKDIPMSEKHNSFAALSKIERNLHRFRDEPVTLIWGMLDWCFTPDFLKQFLQYFPDADVHRFDDAGHYVVEDAHERIVPILEKAIQR